MEYSNASATLETITFIAFETFCNIGTIVWNKADSKPDQDTF